MEIVEVVRQWQAGVSQHGIVRATGVARETVTKYLAAYAMRTPDRLVRQLAFGPGVHTFAVRRLDGPLRWAKLRHVQRLLRLGERYTAEPLEPTCARSLACELVHVRRPERIIALAIEGDPVDEPLSAAQVLPSRFARPGSAFDDRYALHTAEVLA
jgi:hypothetical protein